MDSLSLLECLAFPFVQRALVVGALIALASSLLGVTLVLRRLSYIGDGLSHVAFGAMSLAAVGRMLLDGLAARWRGGTAGNGVQFLAHLLENKMVLVLPVTVACAVLLLCGGRRRIKGDAALAMLSVGALAMGYLVMNIFKPSSNLSGDVCGTLFGSTAILTLTPAEVALSVVLSVAALVLFVLFYNRLFAITFDESFARATGTRTGAYNVMLAVVIAVVIVLAMNLVGSLLISALVIFPAMSAMRLCRSFRNVTVLSVALSVACAVAGMLLSVMAGTPVGATIVALDIAAFAACSALGTVHGR